MSNSIGNTTASLGLSANTPPLRLAVDDKTLNDLRSHVGARDRAAIKQSAEDFESLFLGIVLKSMRDTVQKSGLVDGGNAEDIYRSMLDDEYTKSMSAQRHTGLADNIEQFLLSAVGSQRDEADPAGGLVGPPAAPVGPPAAAVSAATERTVKAQGISAYRAMSQGTAGPPDRRGPLQDGEKQARMKVGPAPNLEKETFSGSTPAGPSPSPTERGNP